MLFNRKPKPPEKRHLALQAHFRRVFEEIDAIVTAVAERKTIPAAPAVTASSDTIIKLFTDVDSAGNKVGHSYSTTDDFKTVNPNLQIEISQFFGDLVGMSAYLKDLPSAMNSVVKDHVLLLIDRIRFEATRLDILFDRYEIAAAILTGRENPDSLAMEEIRRLNVAAIQRFKSLIHKSINPQYVTSEVQKVRMSFLIQIAEKFDTGADRYINGVYFSKERAEQYMTALGRLQASGAAS